ncbi:MAG: hypothetical protein ACOH14_11445 [Rhodoglobus sp.]
MENALRKIAGYLLLCVVATVPAIAIFFLYLSPVMGLLYMIAVQQSRIEGPSGSWLLILLLWYWPVMLAATAALFFVSSLVSSRRAKSSEPEVIDGQVQKLTRRSRQFRVIAVLYALLTGIAVVYNLVPPSFE